MKNIERINCVSPQIINRIDVIPVIGFCFRNRTHEETEYSKIGRKPLSGRIKYLNGVENGYSWIFTTSDGEKYLLRYETGNF